MFKQRETLSGPKILKMYKEGRRDFTDINATMIDVAGKNLKGIIFKNANLGFSYFKNADLTDADFTNANAEWSSFENANLTRTVFVNANATWSKFNKAHFEKTKMQKADLSWSIFFDTNFTEADTKGANLSMIALHPSEITEEGLKTANAMLASLRDKLPFEVWVATRFSVNTTSGKFKTIHNAEVLTETHYSIKSIGGYGSHANDTVNPGNLTYSVSSAYKTDTKYKTKRSY